jgi:hypothetical protein
MESLSWTRVVTTTMVLIKKSVKLHLKEVKDKYQNYKAGNLNNPQLAKVAKVIKTPLII